MNTAQPTLFIDRDGTLVEEPFDQQLDRLAKLRFMPGVFAALTQLLAAGYRLVIVTNQDGLGSGTFPQEDFELCQRFMIEAFASQGIGFDAVCLCPHRSADNCNCRKPRIGMLDAYLKQRRHR
jgi:imidazoleglycerol-phosphate dehydratase/histidinol-phosphatase